MQHGLLAGSFKLNFCVFSSPGPHFEAAKDKQLITDHICYEMDPFSH
jgi:hypothetical protein